MKWLINFLTSSIGRKLIMSLTGLFLIIFLLVHLVGNLQLLANDGGDSFNSYAYFMTTNPLIKTVSYGLYFFIILLLQLLSQKTFSVTNGAGLGAFGFVFNSCLASGNLSGYGPNGTIEAGASNGIPVLLKSVQLSQPLPNSANHYFHDLATINRGLLVNNANVGGRVLT